MKFLSLIFFFFIAFSILSAREITFTVLPSGDLKRKSDEESKKDLKNYVENLPNRGRDTCSRGVREAIKAEYGIDIFDSAKAGDLVIYQGRYAATVQGLDAMLRRNGYEVLNPSGYIPRKGDIQGIVYTKPVNGENRAHAQYFDGSRWVSDHQQGMSYADPQLLQRMGLTPHDVITVIYRRKQRF